MPYKVKVTIQYADLTNHGVTLASSYSDFMGAFDAGSDKIAMEIRKANKEIQKFSVTVYKDR